VKSSGEGVVELAFLVKQELRVAVVFYRWSLQESHEAQVPVPFPDDVDAAGEDFLTVFPHRLDICGAAHTQEVAVSVEQWDSQPPTDPPGRWELEEEAGFESVSGEVALWSDGRLASFVLVKGPGRFQVRASCTGRAEAARRSAVEGVVEGAERYRLQFWPAL
jgi:hypothetical protein